VPGIVSEFADAVTVDGAARVHACGAEQDRHARGL